MSETTIMNYSFKMCRRGDPPSDRKLFGDHEGSPLQSIFYKIFNHMIKLLWFFHQGEMAGLFKDLQASIRDVFHHFLCHGDIGDEVMSPYNDQRWHFDIFQLRT